MIVILLLFLVFLCWYIPEAIKEHKQLNAMENYFESLPNRVDVDNKVATYYYKDGSTRYMEGGDGSRTLLKL